MKELNVQCLLNILRLSIMSRTQATDNYDGNHKVSKIVDTLKLCIFIGKQKDDHVQKAIMGDVHQGDLVAITLYYITGDWGTKVYWIVPVLYALKYLASFEE